MSCYLAHSALPQPAIFIDSKARHNNELAGNLQEFLDQHASGATRLTIDDDNVGRGLVCAFTQQGPLHIKGVMLYAMKQDIQRYLEKQGYQCTSCSDSSVIQCVKKEPSLLLGKL